MMVVMVAIALDLDSAGDKTYVAEHSGATLTKEHAAGNSEKRDIRLRGILGLLGVPAGHGRPSGLPKEEASAIGRSRVGVGKRAGSIAEHQHLCVGISHPALAEDGRI